MAWVEAACVYYLRTLVDRVHPYQPTPLPMRGDLAAAELIREGATMLMLLSVGVLAARQWRKRVGYAAIAFGVWDILYYVFLRRISGWPESVFDWDVLFLLPVPWWGPVIAPMSIALLMIAWGTLVTQFAGSRRAAPTGALRSSGWLGMAVALYVFMADSLHSLPDGVDAATQVLPASFRWPAFCLALALMAAPVAGAGWALPRQHPAGARRGSPPR